MVVGLDLEQCMLQAVLPDIAGVLPLLDWEEPACRPALQHRSIVGIGHDRALRMGCVRFANHAEERTRLRLTIHGPVGIEDLVATMLGVGLREHHQLDVSRVTPRCLKSRQQVIDLIVRQRQPHRDVGSAECSAPARQHRHGLHRTPRQLGKERGQISRSVHRRNHRFGHAVVQHAGQGLYARIGQVCRRRTTPAEEPGQQPAEPLLHHDRIGHTALDAQHLAQPADPRDVGCFARPRADGAQSRHDPQHRAIGGG